MSKAFASQADLADKEVTFTKLSANAYAYTAEGDPNTGVVVGDDAVMVIDTQATPVMAEDVIRHIRTVTDKPVKYVLDTHHHGDHAYGNAVWARAGAKILGAVNIGDGAQIGANAVVLEDVPDHSVAVGVPARIVRTFGQAGVAELPS